MPVQYFTQQLTVTAGAYSNNDVVGGLITFTGLRRGSLQSVIISDKSAQSPDYKLVFFRDTPTNITDNATYSIADADLTKIVKQISLTAAANREAFADNAVYTVDGLDVPLAAHCANLSAFLIATSSAPTYVSTSDVSVKLQVDTDYVSGRNQGSSNIAAIQVGDGAGGELSGTYPVPAVNATHSGSSHANLPAGAQANGVNLMTISSSNNVTNKTIDADNNTITNLAHGSEVDNLTTSHGVTGTIVGTGNTQTLTNKTLTSPIIATTVTLADDVTIALGTSGDAVIDYDGTHLVINTQAVGSGSLSLPGGQIKFPATDVPSSNANTLDDYEQGTFTPSIGDDTLDGSGESQVYDTQVGTYTKIGDVVHVQGYVKITDIGTLTGAQGANLLGLPFVTSSTTANFTGLHIPLASSLAITAGVYVTAWLTTGVSYAQLQQWSATSGTADLTVTELSNNGAFIFSGYYKV